MHTWRRLWYFLIVTLLSACSAHIPQRPAMLTNPKIEKYEELRNSITPWILSGIRKHKITGLSIALAEEGDIVWAEGFGFADKANNRPADTQTLYKAGSISKLFTATAIMQLVEQGRLDLDAPIQEYLPDFQPKYHFQVDSPITLRHIMSHRSGISSDMFAGMFATKTGRFDTEMDYLNATHMPYPPGMISSYSNLAVDLLGVVIERQTGQTFEDYVKTNILIPLGMDSSTFSDSQVDPSRMSKPYRRNKPQPPYAIRNIPAGNLHTSVLELSRFGNMVFNQGKPLLKPESLNQMLQPQTFPNSLYKDELQFGLNWILERPKLKHLGKVAWHNGGTINFMSMFIVLPEQGLSLVVLCNSFMSMPFLEELTDKLLIEAAQLKNGIEPPTRTIAQPRETAFPEDILLQTPGYYATVAGATKLYRSGDRIAAKLAGLTLKTRYYDNGRMSLHPRLFGFIPLPSGPLKQLQIKPERLGEKDLLFAYYESIELIAGTKVKPYAIPDTWHQYLGTYSVQAPPGDYPWVEHATLTERDGYIFLITKGNMPSAVGILRPIADDMAIIEGIGRGAQETIYAKTEGGKISLHYGGYTMQKVK